MINLLVPQLARVHDAHAKFWKSIAFQLELSRKRPHEHLDYGRTNLVIILCNTTLVVPYEWYWCAVPQRLVSGPESCDSDAFPNFTDCFQHGALPFLSTGTWWEVKRLTGFGNGKT